MRRSKSIDLPVKGLGVAPTIVVQRQESKLSLSSKKYQIKNWPEYFDSIFLDNYM